MHLERVGDGPMVTLSVPAEYSILTVCEWRRNMETVRITSPMWGDPSVTGGGPVEGHIAWVAWIATEQQFALSAIWDAVTLIRRQYTGHVY